MLTLNAENRNTNLKPKQLRRRGVIPGVLYGKNLEESLSIQFSQSEATRFLKSNSTGSKAELVIDGKKFPALLREVHHIPATDELEHLSFQTLLAGEVIASTVRISLLNREKVSGMVHQHQFEISYRALPSHLVEKIDIDLDGMGIGTSIRIEDLDISKNPDIELLSPLDTMVLSIADLRRPAEDTSEADEETSETDPQ